VDVVSWLLTVLYVEGILVVSVTAGAEVPKAIAPKHVAWAVLWPVLVPMLVLGLIVKAFDDEASDAAKPGAGGQP
jgi:hypothetical protein